MGTEEWINFVKSILNGFINGGTQEKNSLFLSTHQKFLHIAFLAGYWKIHWKLFLDHHIKVQQKDFKWNWEKNGVKSSQNFAFGLDYYLSSGLWKYNNKQSVCQI